MGATLVVLHHRRWQHGVADLLLGQELFQCVGVVSCELQTEARVLRLHTLLLCPSEQVLEALLVVPHLYVGKLVDHLACDENRCVKRFFRDINANKLNKFHTFAAF